MGPKVMITLAQFAQALPWGTVNIMGGGVTVVAPNTSMLFVAGVVQFGWGAIGTTHNLRIELLDEEGQPVCGTDGEPVVVGGDASLAPAPGVPFGTPLGLPVALPINLPALVPGARYEFKVGVDGETREDWALGFVAMPEAQSKAA